MGKGCNFHTFKNEGIATMASCQTGALLCYHGKSAVVVSVSGDKIEIRTEGGNTKSVRPKDVEWIHPGPVRELPPSVLETPGLEEFLELIGEETLPFGEFAELLYSVSTPAAFWSAYLLLNEGLWFSGSVGSGVKARPRAEIDAALNAAREKAESRERYNTLLERIRKNALRPEDRPFLCEVEELARGKSQNCRILRDLDIEATPEKAHQLLLRLGVWSLLEDPLPVRAGMDMENPSFELPPSPAEERIDWTGMVSLAIDNSFSGDPDDAVGFADGLLWVYVADPASVVTSGSEADLFAARAGENLYLPEKTVHMLPLSATERFGLGLQETNPAISFGIRIEDDGRPVLEKLLLSTVKVERLTYETARERMDRSPLAEIQTALARFREYRLRNGALLIRMPEVHLFLQDGNVCVEPVELTAERELVANAMLAAGAAAADFAVEKEIPMPFAAQSPIEERPGGDTLSAMHALRRACPPGCVIPTPAPHSGLGLPAYIRVTSPLRRYVDLLAHQQLRRYLRGEALLTGGELEERFLPAEKEGMFRRKLERQVNEYWTLVWLAQHPDWSGNAVAVNRAGESTTLLIEELAYEFKSRACVHAAMDEVLPVRLVSVDPAMLTAHFSILR